MQMEEALILVVMDDPLRVDSPASKEVVKKVLILVVMDDPLRVILTVLHSVKLTS